MTAYLDSSVLLRYVLDGQVAIRHAFDFPTVVSSELIAIECRRVLHRLRLTGAIDDAKTVTATERLNDVLKGIGLIDLTAPIKKRAAESFPVVLGTLDALHIATCLACQESGEPASVSVFSHDRSMNLCARALGMRAPLLEE